MKTFIMIIAIVAIVLGLLALGSWLFELVWNAVLPAVFGWKVLTFWQATGIVFLLGFIGGVVRTNSKS